MHKPGQEPDEEMNDPDDYSNMQWRILDRHYFMQNNAKVNCAAFHAESNLIVVGFSTGVFGLYEMPEFNQIHTLRSVIHLLCPTNLEHQ